MAKKKKNRLFESFTSGFVSEWNADNEVHDKDELLEQIAGSLRAVDKAPSEVLSFSGEFLGSVSGKLKDIAKQVEAEGVVTRRQYESVQNMTGAIDKCLRKRK